MSVSVSFRVDGIPQPKGSVTRMPSGGMIPAGTTASRQRKADWRSDIRAAASEAWQESQPGPPMLGPVQLDVSFELPYPRSSIRKYQLGWVPMVKKPDIDKLLRLLLDALTGIIWVDDNQVCYIHLQKHYAWDHRPGADISIIFRDEEYCKQLAANRFAIKQAQAIQRLVGHA